LGAQKSQHSAGWYAGALLFWLLTAWLITVGLSSIIPQIFWPNGDVQSEASSCSPALRELQRELLSRTSERIARSSTAAVASDREALLAWFEDWDQRLFQARNSCSEPERAAWTELGRLRHGMQALIERFEREEAPRIQRLEQLLGLDEQGEEARLLHPRKTTQP
jgi:hypothetical protein